LIVLKFFEAIYSPQLSSFFRLCKAEDQHRADI